MKLIKSFLAAISTYSIIPTPRFEWNEENTRYSVGFLPVIGIVIGGAYYAIRFLQEKYALPEVMTTAVLTFVPILLTGGIHMDGFMDTTDAIASHQSRERKLEIMKDSGVGAFAVIYSILYFMLQFAILYTVKNEYVLTVSLLFVVSRAASGIIVETTPNARKAGMLSDIDSKKGKVVKLILLFVFLAASVTMMFIANPVAAGVIVAVGIVWSLVYRIYMMQTIKGVTGDTSGFFLQVFEILTMAAVAVLIIIMEG